MQALYSANTKLQIIHILERFQELAHFGFFCFVLGLTVGFHNRTKEALVCLLLSYGGTISGTRILLILFIENILNAIVKENSCKCSALTNDTIPFEQL